jgi:hypothetical protein
MPAMNDYAPGTRERCRWGTLTPHATAPLEFRPVEIYATGAGTIVAIDEEGNEATFTVAANSFIKLRPVRILDTSTATGLIGIKY